MPDPVDTEVCPACRGEGAIPNDRDHLVVTLTVPQSRAVLAALREQDSAVHNVVWHQLRQQTGVPLY